MVGPKSLLRRTARKPLECHGQAASLGLEHDRIAERVQAPDEPPDDPELVPVIQIVIFPRSGGSPALCVERR
jgi:hypothetical protein